jgi:hypothetical protein
VTNSPSAGTSHELFKAERKKQRNRWADFLNRLEVFRDQIAPSEFGCLYKQVSPFSMMSHARLKGIFRGVRDVVRRKVKGDLVECGTARGGCSALMGLTCRQIQTSRKIWVYDTFEGLPAPTQEDPDFDLAKSFEGDCRGDYDEVRELFERFQILDDVQMVKGLFQDTLPSSEIQQIALLHLDGDWYDSTWVCLEQLYDKVTPGGVIQIDDYGHWAGARKALHKFFDQRKIQVDLQYLDYTGRQFIKPS